MKSPFIYLFAWLFIFTASAQKKSISLDQIWEGSLRTQGMTALHSMNNGQHYSVLNFNRSSRSTSIDLYDYKTLSKNIWDCKEVKPTSTLWEHGIWGDRESVRNYKHYGMEKRYILDDRLNYGYDQTMHYLYRCTNAGRLLDIATLKTNLKTIENR